MSSGAARNGQRHSTGGQNLGGASPELRAKLQKQWSRLYRETKTKESRTEEARAEEEIFPTSANVPTPRLEGRQCEHWVAEFVPEASKVGVSGVVDMGVLPGSSGNNADPFEYQMLDCSMEVASYSRDSVHTCLKAEATWSDQDLRRQCIGGMEDAWVGWESTRDSQEPALSELSEDVLAAGCEDSSADDAEEQSGPEDSSADDAKEQSVPEEPHDRRRSCGGRFISWVVVPLLAVCIGVGLAQQDDRQARKLDMQILATTVVLGAAGAAILGSLTLLICPWSCVRWLFSVLVPLVAGAAAFAVATITGGAPAGLAIVDGNA